MPRSRTRKGDLPESAVHAPITISAVTLPIMTRRRRPHPLIPTLLGTLLGVPVYEAALSTGALFRGAFSTAVVAALILGLVLGVIPRKPVADAEDD